MARPRKAPQDTAAPAVMAVEAKSDLVLVTITHGDAVTLGGGQTAAPQEPVRVAPDLAEQLIEKGLARRG